jgi:autotransporter translocation and assembly factor TamB
MHLAGTRKHPHVVGNFDVERMGLRGLQIPRTVGSISLDGHNLVVRDMQVTFPSGSLELGGAVPFTLSPFGIGPGSVPVALNLAAKNIDLSVFRPLLPLGSEIAGTVDGNVAVMGTAGDPRLDGKLALAGGLLATPFEKVPLRNVTADVIFGKTDIHVRKLHADMGGGTLDAHGVARVSDLTQLSSDVAYGLKLTAKHARVDFPLYGAGTVDGSFRFSHAPRELPLFSGSLTLNDTNIPFSALYHPDTATEPPPLPFNFAFDVNAVAGRNVHVRSDNMDIATSGTVKVGGSLSNLVLDGSFDSSGGTLTYFNRIFRVIGGTVTFEPDMGIVPLLDARASTHVFDPGSLTGFADITLTMTGPVTNLTLGLDSDPSYDREQILALLLSAPQIGALLGSGTAAHPTATGGQLVGEEAFSVVNARFTQTLLAPLESAFGQALGLSNLNVDVDYTGGVNVTARKLLGKKVNAVYASGVSYPYRQSFGFELKPNNHTSAQMTIYQTLGQTGLGIANPTNFNAAANRLLLAQPSSGTNGFSFSFLQYWP